MSNAFLIESMFSCCCLRHSRFIAVGFGLCVQGFGVNTVFTFSRHIVTPTSYRASEDTLWYVYIIIRRIVLIGV
jgi:hypothetical protein